MSREPAAARRSILIVDDDPRVRTSLAQALGAEAGDVRTATSGKDALVGLADAVPDLVLADLKMPGMDGIELLRALHQRAPAVDVVIMTAHDDLPTVATAMREGARDFLVKPLDLHALRRLLSRIFEDRDTRAHAGAGSTRVTAGIADRLVGRDRRMVEIFKVVGRVAATQATVIIRGESGTGKELIAREIHRASTRAEDPFVAVTCTAVPETLLESELFGHVRGAFTGATADRKGRFAQAGRGTIFLDEIGDTSPEFQSKLLRVLQEREFHPVGADRPEKTDARVIAATHRDLEAMLVSGDFREDLYYRLRVVEILVPPLRERMSDLPQMVEHFVARTSEAAGRRPPVLTSDAFEKLRAHTWPGNVRELQNCIARAVVTASGDVIRPEDFELAGEAGGRAPSLALSAAERAHVERVLALTNGHKARAADLLEISRPRLDRIIDKYGLGVPGRRGHEASDEAEP